MHDPGISLEQLLAEPRERMALQRPTLGASELHSFLASVSHIAVLVDRRGTVLFVNRVEPGLSRDQVVGTNCLDYLAPEHREAAQRAVEQGFLTGMPQSMVLKSLAGFSYECWLMPIGDSESNQQAVLIAHDVTDQRRVQEQLEALHTAMERRATELEAMARELTQSEEHERQRVVHLLHDDLQQLLVAAHHKLGRLRHHLDDAQLDQLAQELDGLLDDCIRATRSLSIELSPPELYQHGLVAALNWLARQMAAQHGLTVLVHAQAAEPADQNVQIFLYQIVRELLFNVVKHARTERAWVNLTSRAGELQIEVGDEGVGFDPASLAHRPDTAGLGLFSIRARLARFRGHLDFDTAPGRGARIMIRLPGEGLRTANE